MTESPLFAVSGEWIVMPNHVHVIISIVPGVQTPELGVIERNGVVEYKYELEIRQSWGHY